MKKSICVRLLLIVFFLFLGTKLSFFFFVAAFIALSIFSDLSSRGEPKKLADSPQLNINWTFINAETPNWKSIYLDRMCESPAEVEFLTAMISSYQLIPDKGTLKGGGLELQLQIPIDRYRVDFLANKYLVVEVDGAAYHSSPEAVEKDRIRDEFLTRNRFVVLRIPAKVVFNSPIEAVQRVRSALSNLAHERNIRAQEEARVKALNPSPTFFGALGKAMEDSSKWMDHVLVLQKSAEPFNETFDIEKHVIETAIKMAKQSISIESWIKKDPRNQQRYSESLRALRQAVESAREPSQANSPSAQAIEIPPLRPPDLGSDPKYSTAIKEMYSSLLEKRLQYFNDVRNTLEKDHELARHVKKVLEESFQNCADRLWQLVRVNTDPTPQNPGAASRSCGNSELKNATGPSGISIPHNVSGTHPDPGRYGQVVRETLTMEE